MLHDRLSRRRALVCAAWAALATHAQAVAQPEPPGRSESAEAPEGAAAQPPRLRPPSAPRCPPAALPAGLADPGPVVLVVQVAPSGEVTDAQVAEPMGTAADDAALEAARRCVFEPATRDDVPVAARVRLAISLEPGASDGPDEAPTGRVAGAVRVRALLPGRVEAPAVGARVLLEGPDGQVRSARTDGEGLAALDDVPPGRHALRVEAPGVGGGELDVFVLPGQPTEVSLRLEGGGDEAPLEVTVEGVDAGERLRRSAEAVQVIGTEDARRETADLGEVLARSQGVGVRRAGGLGSGARFSLNGLTDDQIRFFLDGVPLELAGFPFGLANVPIDLVERIEIYRGVVPVRFGADALGGAVNLATPADLAGTHASASYTGGSFNTHRLSLGARNLDERTGFFSRVSGFFDHADNDYPIDVEVPDDRGRLSPARVYRFHDAYRAAGGNVEVGLVDRPFADRLILRAFVTDYRKELQHNVVMTVPYGEVEYGELQTGASLRFAHDFGGGVSIDAVAGYTYGATELLDVAECVYDWFGRCVRDRRTPGEIEARPRDQVIWQHDGFARVAASWRFHPDHELRLALAPTYTTRTGDDRRQSDPDARDPLTARRDLFTLVTGVEYEADLFGGRLENVLFVKDYVQLVRSEEPLPGGGFQEQHRDTHRLGIGNAARWRFDDRFWAKASYEYATRLPRVDEIFGDGALIVDNLELAPETSHNVNVGFTVDARDTPTGAWRADVNGFLREADQLIVLLGNDRVFTYQNVFGARSVGVEAAAGWTSPGDWVELDGNFTYLDFRNSSSEGTFGDFAGDRIPNRPYLFANGAARFRARGVAADRDELSLFWNTRYVHEFFRGWESVGLRAFKQTVPSQLVHSLGLTYAVFGGPVDMTFTGEVQNLTDADAFDFFGVQRPGRFFLFRVTATY